MPLTLGEMIQQLEVSIQQARESDMVQPDKVSVSFDFVDALPTSIECWRGWYVEPALGWEPSGYSRHQKGAGGVTASELLAELKKPLPPWSEVYQGWKGGDYQFNCNSPLHVANPGDSNYTMIESVKFHEYRIVIHTVWVESGGL